MSIEFDFSEVAALSASLATAGAALPKLARGVVQRGALNIKNETRKNVSQHPTWKHLASTVNYTMKGNAAFSQAVVGYDDTGQGELAGIAEFGSSRHAPHPALLPALKDEAPRFEKAMLDAVTKALS